MLVETGPASVDGWASPSKNSYEKIGACKMSKKRDYHVVPRGDDWALTREGAARATSLHPTQTVAARAGRSLAQRHGTELVIHRPDGRIRDSDSFGGDPNPPKDQKH